MNWPTHIKRHKIPLYGGYLVVVRNRKDNKTVMDLFEEEAEKNDTAIGRTSQLYKGCVPYYLVSVYAGGTQCLIHELAHATFMVLANVGVPVTKSGHNEAYCYLLDALYGLATSKT